MFLRRFINAPSSSSRQATVEIHVDQRCVGELTPQMSQRFLPMIQHSGEARIDKRMSCSDHAQARRSPLSSDLRSCPAAEISAPYS